MNKSPIEEVMSIQKSLEESVAQRMTEFESRFVASAGSSEVTVSKLHQEYLSFKELVMNVFKLCQQQISFLSGSVDALDMRSRRKVLLVAGIAEANEECLAETVAELFSSTLHVEVSPNCLQLCHRLGKRGERPRPVLVRFQSLQLRNIVWQKKSMFKGTSYTLSEFLTRPRQAVFVEARTHFGMKPCWTMDGIINIKLPSGDRVKLTTKAELQDLMQKFPASRGKSDEARQPAVTSQHKKTGPSTSVTAAAADKKIMATRKQTQVQSQAQRSK